MAEARIAILRAAAAHGERVGSHCPQPAEHAQCGMTGPPAHEPAPALDQCRIIRRVAFDGVVRRPVRPLRHIKTVDSPPAGRDPRQC